MKDADSVAARGDTREAELVARGRNRLAICLRVGPAIGKMLALLRCAQMHYAAVVAEAVDVNFKSGLRLGAARRQQGKQGLDKQFHRLEHYQLYSFLANRPGYQ